MVIVGFCLACGHEQPIVDSYVHHDKCQNCHEFEVDGVVSIQRIRKTIQ